MDEKLIIAKTILITGGTGFLGSNLLRRLILNKYKVILLKRSYSNTHRIDDVLSNVKYYNIDQVDLSVVFKDQPIDVVLHCATDYGRKQSLPLQVIEANLILPLKLLELGKENKVKCFINTDTILDKRVSHYSLSKAQFIDWLKTYQDDIVCVNMALEHFYGPGDDKTKFVSNIFDSLLNKVKSINLTKGEQQRDFVYIDDVVDAFMLVIKNLTNNADGFFHYEIGTNKLISIRWLVETIKELSNNHVTELNFGALPYRENEVMQSVSDTIAIKHLGWVPNYDIKRGLEKMLLIERNKKII
ncbi:MAG: NAD(P)-dependent oxidoreductase [Candidatus Magasanikbacteria bacterium]